MCVLQKTSKLHDLISFCIKSRACAEFNPEVEKAPCNLPFNHNLPFYLSCRSLLVNLAKLFLESGSIEVRNACENDNIFYDLGSESKDSLAQLARYLVWSDIAVPRLEKMRDLSSVVDK